MNTKMKKVLSILLTILIICMFCTSVYALDKNSFPDGNATDDYGDITTIGNKIVTVIQIVGAVVAVAILAILGIKYMLGSAEDKSEYKQSMMPYIIGAILIFAATSLARIIYNFVSGL